MSNAEQTFTDELRTLAKMSRDCDVEGHSWAEFVRPPWLICLFCGSQKEIEETK